MTCACYACTKALVMAEPLPASEKLFGTVDPRMARMFLCDTCGNKRCPHAADHLLSCTGSNKSGQAGSLYEGAAILSTEAPKPADSRLASARLARAEQIPTHQDGEGTP